MIKITKYNYYQRELKYEENLENIKASKNALTTKPNVKLINDKGDFTKKMFLSYSMFLTLTDENILIKHKQFLKSTSCSGLDNITRNIIK